MLRSKQAARIVLLLASSAALAQCAESDAPVANAPYSALRHVITMKHNPDGTSRRSEATQHEARDSKGRSYRAGARRWTTLVDGKSVAKSETLVRISHPVANTETQWDTSSKVAKVIHFPSSDDVAVGGHVDIDAFSFDATATRIRITALPTAWKTLREKNPTFRFTECPLDIG